MVRCDSIGSGAFLWLSVDSQKPIPVLESRDTRKSCKWT